MLICILACAAAGIGGAFLSIACYRKGLKDGNDAGARTAADTTEGEQSALMKKYEAIMGYDPYGEKT